MALGPVSSEPGDLPPTPHCPTTRSIETRDPILHYQGTIGEFLPVSWCQDGEFPSRWQFDDGHRCNDKLMDKLQLKSIVEKISNINDSDFFNSLCLALADVTRAQFVFVAALDKDEQRATTLSLAAHHKIIDNFSYSLIDTPCADVGCGELSCYPSDIQACFPRDSLLVEMAIQGYLGVPIRNVDGEVVAILVALYQQPIEQQGDVISLFQLFTGLVEKEFEKRSVIRKLAFANRIIQDSHEAICVCDEAGEIRDVNAAFSRISGYSLQEVVGQNPRVLKSGHHDPAFYQALWSQLVEKGFWHGEFINRRKNGEIFHTYSSIKRMADERGEVSYVAMFLDVTERVDAMARIRYQATHDSLTKLNNRFHFSERLVERITRRMDLPQPRSGVKGAGAEGHHSCAVIVFDVKSFNEINHAYGSSFGDRVLIAIAQRLRVLMPEKTPSRIDGNGFAILTDYQARSELSALCEQIFRSIARYLVVDGVSLSISFSFGIATLDLAELFTDEPFLATEVAEKLIGQAEQAARQAKRCCADESGSTALFFDRSMEAQVNHLAAAKLALSRAVDHQQLEVFFQPIVDTERGKIAKLEALVRWQREGRWVSPEVFIPIAESNGLIVPIGDFVLRQSCRQLKTLDALGFGDIAININRSIFEFPAGTTEVNPWLEIIAEEGIAPERITFELTESVLAPDDGNHLRCLEQLRQAGCKVALDDFGTGYSSLSYLRRFPINYLKIDKSFVQGITHSDQDRILVSSIIQMTQALGIRVVAEGIETQEHLEIINGLGCHLIQGFHFARPMPPAQLHRFLARYQPPFAPKRPGVATGPGAGSELGSNLRTELGPELGAEPLPGGRLSR